MRIKDLPDGTQSNNDYIAIDNGTEGTRKVKPMYLSISSPTHANGILDYALNVAKIGQTIVSLSSMGTSDLPDAAYSYSVALIEKRASNTGIGIFVIPTNGYLSPISNTCVGGSWYGWRSNGSIYSSSTTDFFSILQKNVSSTSLFRLNPTSCNAVFGMGSYVGYGVVGSESDGTSAVGMVVINGNVYQFSANPSTQTVNVFNRLAFADETMRTVALKSWGSSTAEDSFDITDSGVYLLFLSKDNITGAATVHVGLIGAYLRSGSDASSNKAYYKDITSLSSSFITSLSVTASTTAKKATITIKPNVAYVTAYAVKVGAKVV